MSISLLLEMASSIDPERTAIVSDDSRVTARELGQMADRGAQLIARSGAEHVAYIGTGGTVLPLLLFSSARAATPMTPLNYRLSADAVRDLVERLPAPLLVVDAEYRELVEALGKQVIDSDAFLAASRSTDTPVAIDAFADPDSVAVVLFTSGTTSRPKAVELTHANLTSYVMGTVEFSSAEDADAALICVPPYHIAGVGAALTNLFAGRKSVYLKQFDARRWIELVRTEAITNATVVPTMLDRIVSVLAAEKGGLPTLRTLAYGGSRVPLPLIRTILDLLPDLGLVNAYGLTETSSTIAVLTPEDHRLAHGSDDQVVAQRLGSVGRAVSGMELQIRDAGGVVVDAGVTGELFVRGPQVSGTYAEIGSVLDTDGWFPTRDIATIDDDGYLYIGGRSDDTIIRGGENVAPAEIEEVLVEHPHVHDVAVVGVDDTEWGQIIVAVVVPVAGSDPDPTELREYVRLTLRGSRTPDRIVFRDELPTTPTGEVLRRALVDELCPAPIEQ